MKTKMIMIFGMSSLLIIGCHQVQKEEIVRALDVDITIDEEAKESELPCCLSLSFTNESLNPLPLPNGLIVLEFTSYSGSVSRTVPLSDDLIESDLEWRHYTDYTLQPGEKIDLKVALGEILLGGPGRVSIGLPADNYTLNAFLTFGKKIEDIHMAAKVRSNYIDLAVDYPVNNLSVNSY